MSLDAIGIVSKNIEKSIQFYGMLEVRFKEIINGSGHWEGNTPGGVRIMLDSINLIKKTDPDWQKTKGNGVVLCFKQNTPNKVDELYYQIIRAGFTGVKPPWDAFWGQRYCSVLDADENQVDIFASL